MLVPTEVVTWSSYLWEILHRDTDELVRKVYETQKINHNKGDWFLIMQDERTKYGIEETDTNLEKLWKRKSISMH